MQSLPPPHHLHLSCGASQRVAWSAHHAHHARPCHDMKVHITPSADTPEPNKATCSFHCLLLCSRCSCRVHVSRSSHRCATAKVPTTLYCVTGLLSCSHSPLHHKILGPQSVPLSPVYACLAAAAVSCPWRCLRAAAAAGAAACAALCCCRYAAKVRPAARETLNLRCSYRDCCEQRQPVASDSKIWP